MAKIQLIVDADSAEDLNDTLRALAGGESVSGETYALGYAQSVNDAEPVEAAEGETQRRRRRTKAEIAADAALAAANLSDGKAATSVSEPTTATEAGPPGTGGGTGPKVADVFGDQIKEVAAEAKAEGAPTLDMIKTALTACMSAKGALAAQTILKEHANGVGRVSEIDPAHYAAVYAALTA